MSSRSNAASPPVEVVIYTWESCNDYMHALNHGSLSLSPYTSISGWRYYYVTDRHASMKRHPKTVIHTTARFVMASRHHRPSARRWRPRLDALAPGRTRLRTDLRGRLDPDPREDLERQHGNKAQRSTSRPAKRAHSMGMGQRQRQSVQHRSHGRSRGARVLGRGEGTLEVLTPPRTHAAQRGDVLRRARQCALRNTEFVTSRDTIAHFSCVTSSV